MKTQIQWAALALLVMAGAACDRILPQRTDESLPELQAIAELYGRQGLTAEFRYSGNVLEMLIQQPGEQLRRGGALWARVGPYIYLFSPGTREVFERYPGIAGVRAITTAGDAEVARALLLRGELNEYGWRRALNVLGSALQEGTARPSTMDRLVQFGEQHTQYEYSPEYVPPR
jgi:hypothetical protein